MLGTELSNGDRLDAIDAGLLVLSSLIAFSGVMFAPAYPDWITALGTDHGASIASLWTLAAPAGGVALGVPLFQWVERDFGALRMLRLGCALLFLSGSMAMISTSAWQFLLARGLVGISASALMIGTVTIFALRYPGVVWKEWLLFQDVVGMLSAVVGLLLVGALAYVGWTIPLFLHALGLPAYGLVWWLSGRPGLRALLRRHRAMERARVGRPPARALTRAGPLDAARRRPTQAMILVTMALCMGLFFGVVQVVAAIVSTDLEIGPVGISVALAALMFAVACSMYASGVLRRALGASRSVGVCCAVVALGFVCISGSRGFWGLVAALCVLGMGFGALRPLLIGWLDRVARPTRPAARYTVAIPAWYVGITLSPLFVLFVQDWRRLALLGAIPMAAMAMLYVGGSWIPRLRWSDGWDG